MNCLNILPTNFYNISVGDNYYNELLFNQILKDKKITVDSFNKLYSISKNFHITGISDSKGNCSFIIETDKEGYSHVTSTKEIKKKQLKINFAKNGFFGEEGWIIVDYD